MKEVGRRWSERGRRSMQGEPERGNEGVEDFHESESASRMTWGFNIWYSLPKQLIINVQQVIAKAPGQTSQTEMQRGETESCAAIEESMIRGKYQAKWPTTS